MNRSQARRRAAVTGIGVVAPNGVGTDQYWKATCEGTSVLAPIDREGCEQSPLRIAGLIKGFDAAQFVEERILVATDRFTHYALAAAGLALADSELPVDAERDADDPFGIGVVTAAGSGGGEFGQGELQQLWSQGPHHVGPYQSIAWFYAASTGQISIRGGFKGPCGVVASDEAGGLDALAHAARDVVRGTTAVVVGAAEAPIAPYSMVCQLGYPELSTATDAKRAYLPFTEQASGFAPAEGGAFFVLEDEATARARGARIRAVLAGHGATFTGASRWAESRDGLAHAMRGALAEANCAPEEVDVVFADALAVPDADRAEALALADVLGKHAARVPVTAPKAGIGRAYCGGSALDTASAALCLEQGLIPPTPNVSGCAYDLDLVTGFARAAAPRTALVLSRGLMGSNSAVLLRLGSES
ncbi:Beta-ketoacyl synthase [Catenulispora acidiphila DSM 44928]|uniref:Beta-ketoacyl synthase n=1 Tax=Catenulispora acidiphila (strain DSM 44928 / JCM 14897 / NBRC 102108 / NRRL B-24433 / ID139908) TaxID=479433 RepID=C7Q5R6_CATAD|nr:beta-ketoacyl synthase N-terminal-like domain-containing protein [Catenulispora acidiphila]ACU70013.1 Beta-ketoacyl synthase [Catenulispora acidiphila DSM 44928]